jgi:peptidoglycan hydrolase-like protein with peptidoglycan-binding domain
MPAESVDLAVQQALARLGYYRGPVNGVVGPQTEKDIRWFQSVNSLPITGQINFATLRALRIRLTAESARVRSLP